MINNEMHASLSDDYALLELMLSDARLQRDIYKPGPYWRKQSNNAAAQIKKHGLADFRGCSSTIGLSFTDSIYVDFRHDLNGSFRWPLKFLFESVFPFNKIFDAQVSLTKSHENEARRMKN